MDALAEQLLGSDSDDDGDACGHAAPAAPAAAPGAAAAAAGAADSGSDSEAMKVHSAMDHMEQSALVVPGQRVLQAFERNAKRRRLEAERAPANPGFTRRHGNYSSYYGYRSLQDDHRILYLDRIAERLRGRRWLDVGCNDGQLTYLLAERLRPSSVLGVDIDGDLVARARRLLQSKRAQLQPPDDVPLIASECGPLPVPPGPTLPERMRFETVDMAADKAEVPGAPFDAVLCLSVTKWVHLNGGDRAVKRLLLRCFQLLSPGGVLVLEPQPWASYKKFKCHADKRMKANYQAVEFRPGQFEPWLLQVCGFESSEYLVRARAERVRGEKRVFGFNRDLIIFSKPR